MAEYAAYNPAWSTMSRQIRTGMMAVQARLDWLRLTRAAKTHDQLSRRNPADVADCLTSKSADRRRRDDWQKCFPRLQNRSPGVFWADVETEE